jgi:hypothetical protein
MLSLQYLVHACHDFFQNECSALDKPGAGIKSLSENAIASAVARQILRYKDNIFHYETGWEHNAGAKRLRFHYSAQPDKEEFVDLQIKKAALNENLGPFISENYIAGAEEKVRRFALILIEGDEKDQRAWAERWINEFATDIKPVYTSCYRYKTSNTVNNTCSWMVLWELPVKMANDATPKNISGALYDAVRYMHYENMVNILRKVISLRINVEEDLIQPDTDLSTLYKMSFAREQGVPLDEVYDPEAMKGLTDSQLATNNLLNDMQKTFGVDFDPADFQKINTIKDLARTIVAKKTMETF